MLDTRNTANALWLAYDENLVVSSVTAKNNAVISGITIDAYEDAGPIKWFRGEDASGIPIQFAVKYESVDENKLVEVSVYRGRAGVEYGVVTNIVVG